MQVTPELTGTAGVSSPGGLHAVPPVNNPSTRLPEIPASHMSTPLPSPQLTGRGPNIPAGEAFREHQGRDCEQLEETLRSQVKGRLKHIHWCGHPGDDGD